MANVTPTIKVQGQVFSIQQILDKTLYAAKPLKGYVLPDEKSAVIADISTGYRVGEPYSWVTGTTNKAEIWLQFWYTRPAYAGGDIVYYVKPTDSSFMLKQLKDQGALTVKEQQEKKDEKDKDFWDHLQDVGKYAAFAGGGYIAWRYFLQPMLERRRNA